MNEEHNHIIEKVFLEINTNSVTKGNEIKNNIGVFLNKELLPHLERLLDLYDAKNEIIRFETLNLGLNVRNWKNSEELKSEFERELGKQIKGEILVAKKRLVPQKRENTGTILSIEDSREATFLFFIENGFQPWFGKEEYLSEITSKSFWIKTIENPVFVSKFARLLKNKNSDSVHRFIFQFSEKTVISFIQKLNTDIDEFHADLVAVLKGIPQNCRDLLLQLLLEISLKKDVDIWIETVKKLIAQLLDVKKSGVFRPKPKFLGNMEKQLKNLVPESHHNILSHLLTDFQKVDIPNELSRVKRTEEVENGYGNHSQIKEDKLIKVPIIKKKQKEFLFASNETELIVRNAGLILLHPFLKYFFLETNIIEESGNFKPGKKIIAVQALHYLATGNENVFESNLVFEKFLCNFPLKKSLNKKSLLSPEIKSEAEILLKAAIKNWPELKNTSPIGLRGLFIQRDGKLIYKKNRYKLIVERKPQDLLLDKLKWNISVIKLPWKKDLLIVEW